MLLPVFQVLDFHHPHQLKEGLNGFSLELPEQPETLEQILVDCRDTLKYGVRTGVCACLTVPESCDSSNCKGSTNTFETSVAGSIEVAVTPCVLRACCIRRIVSGNRCALKLHLLSFTKIWTCGTTAVSFMVRSRRPQPRPFHHTPHPPTCIIKAEGTKYKIDL